MKISRRRQEKSGRQISRATLWLCVFVILCTPALIQSEVLYLKDGSMIRGSVVDFARDTLTFDPNYGGRMKVSRSQIVKIVFSDSVETSTLSSDLQRREAGKSATMGGKGSLAVRFKDKKVNSKVEVHRTRDERQIKEANWVVQLLIVDGDTIFAHIDSTVDKTINKGHDKHYKNNFEIKEMTVELPAGLHHCVVTVCNKGLGVRDDDFKSGPLDMILNLDNVQIFPDRTTSVTVGIKKGKLRLGKPRFYRVQ